MINTIWQWFVSRISSTRLPYFKWEDVNGRFLMGEKSTDQGLEVACGNREHKIILKINKQYAEKIRDWLNEQYPKGGDRNVIQLVPKLSSTLPVQQSTGDTETIPPGPPR